MDIYKRDLFIYGNLWEKPFYLWISMLETFLFMEIYERDLFIYGNLWESWELIHFDKFSALS